MAIRSLKILRLAPRGSLRMTRSSYCHSKGTSRRALPARRFPASRRNEEPPYPVILSGAAIGGAVEESFPSDVGRSFDSASGLAQDDRGAGRRGAGPYGLDGRRAADSRPYVVTAGFFVAARLRMTEPLPLPGELRACAVGGRRSKLAISAAVGECKEKRKPAAFSANGKAGETGLSFGPGKILRLRLRLRSG